jgi:peptidoglycan LD-endopeptidase LytH
MKNRRPARPFPLAAVLVAFCAGVLVDWALRTYGPPQPVDAPTSIGPRTPEARIKPGAETDTSQSADDASAVPGANRPKPAPAATSGSVSVRLPIDNMDLDAVKGGFYEARAGHRHEAVDILAPRNTPIHAVSDGTIAKLFVSKLGGNTIYQFDPSGQFAYYYAHLERYADGLRDGQAVAKGDIIGYVGTSGNAPANTPHLHFGVFQLDQDQRWWDGKPLDPYEVFHK